MRAAVLVETDAPLTVLDDVRLPDLGPHDVRVRIRAAGLCHSDLSFQNGTFPLPKLPSVLGHEAAGEVVGVGAAVRHVRVGNHVILAWVPPCGSCFFCINAEPYLCVSGFSAAGPVWGHHGEQELHAGFGVGGFAEETVVPSCAVVPVPTDVPFELAALIGCAVTTGIGAAMNTVRVSPASRVLVIGCGGVGVNIVQGCRAVGASTLVAVDPLEDKRALACELGATAACTPEEVPEAVRGHTDGIGFDIAFEAVGRASTIRQAWDATRRGGTTVVVGAGSVADTVEFTASELFSPGKSIVGSRYGSANVRTDFHHIVRLWRAGRVDLSRLVSQVLTLEQINDGMAALRAGSVTRTVIRM